MKSGWKVLSGILALVLVGLGFVWSIPSQSMGGSPAARAAGGAALLPGSSSTTPVTVTVSGPYTPTLSVAVRDLPPINTDLPNLDREPAQRDGRGFVGPDIQMPPHGNPLADLQRSAPAPAPDDFGTPILNFAGIQSSSSPPDDTGDIGLNHYLQADNGPGGSRVTIYDKTGVQQAQFLMETLAATSPCNNGYCDPIVQYDELADRWMISEFDSSAQTLCVYVSKTPDPLGQWWAYAFNPPSSGMQDYPKYAVWPDGYYIAANNGGWVIVLDRVKMIAGQPATMQEFFIGSLPNFGFELSMPATLEGPAPPSGAPAYYLRPRDTEIHGGTCPGCDLMEMWELHVDWVTPANSSLTPVAGVQLNDWDQTLCGIGSDWSCMPQPGTLQQLDPIREPIHYPLQYRNFGTHETLVGCFAEDVDGTDHAAVHWFEIRRTPPGSGSWVKYQEGVLGGEYQVHRSVCSAAMDSAGNIAVGYTRTGNNAPYYPSIYYSGRLASDPLGTMPYYDHVIWDATTSKTNNERWGDYSGIGVDPSDGCTFWYTTEYGGSGQTRIASFKFDACGTPDFTIAATPDTLAVCAPEVTTSTIQIGQVLTYSQPVALAAMDVPAGTSAAFAPPTVTPPGASVLTLDVSGATADGDYTLIISGTAEGTNVHTVPIALRVRSAPPGAPALLNPPNGATEVSPAGILFEWTAVPGAASYRLQVDDDPAFGSPDVDLPGITANQHTLAAALDPATFYYWRVQADNACGSGSFSPVFYFSTRALCILLVDDDNNGPDVQPYFTAALDTLGYSYDLFDVGGGGGNGPALDALSGYPIVIWFSGDKYGASAGPNAADEANLAAYLDGGGHLFLSSQDYLYDYGLTAFGQNYLGIGSFNNDSGDATSKTGVAGDPIGDGLGPFNLTYPTGFSDFGDTVAAASAPASQAFIAGNNSRNLDVDKDGGTWKTVFFGTDWVPIYHNSAANGRLVLERILDWFGGCGGCQAPVDVSFDWTPLEPVAGEEVTFSGSVSGTAPLLFAWTFGDGGAGLGATVVHTFAAAGSYTVTLTATNACGSDSVGQIITVLAPACEPVQIVTVTTAVDGCAVTFGAEFTGTAPYTWQWDFGAFGTSTATNPLVDFGASGTYPYTLTAANACGDDLWAGEVSVECAPPCEPVQIVTVTTAIDGCQVTFGTALTGTAPYTWQWDFGAFGTSTATNPLVDFGASGTYPYTLTAANACGDDLWAGEVSVECTPPCTEVTGVELTVVTTGTIYPGDLVDFAADISPDDFTAPYSYTVDYGDGTAPVSGSDSADPLTWSYSYTAVGTYTVEIAVWNCAMAEPVVAAVEVVVLPVCVELVEITIAGPVSGAPGVYTFTTSYAPADATPPIAYLWDNGGATAGSVRTLGVGTHTLVVTATNCASALVTDTHTIVITAPVSYMIYLPVVYRAP